MPTDPRHPNRPLTRLVVLWLIALVLPLQGAAAGVFGALGPAHLHQRAASTLVLEDVRRWRPAPTLQAHAPGGFGHAHARAAPQRHHHAADDGSVVRTGADPADADEAPGASAVPVLALIPEGPTWLHRHDPMAAVARPLWSLRTGFTRHPARPPKFG